MKTTWVVLPLALVLCAAARAESSSPCLIEPAQKLVIRSSVTATIVAMPVDRGSVIRKGQLLASLDASVESAALASAKYRSVMQGQVTSAEARLTHSKDKLARREELRRQNYVSAQDRDDTAAEARIAEADLLEARDNRQMAVLDAQRIAAELGRRSIVSPVNGVVMERSLQPGELAQAGETASSIMKIAQTDPARIEVILPVAKYGKVKVGDLVNVKPEQPFAGSYKATVRVVDTVVDSASGTFGVRLEYPNPDSKVPLGVRCSAEL